MSNAGRIFRRHAKRMTAALLIVISYWFARLPVLSSAERESLADRFRFVSAELPEVGGPRRKVRPVRRGVEGISAWISSVGASIALSDFDGDGLPNDLCYIDPRSDQVIIAPAPGTPARYRPFAFDHAKIDYDPRTMAPMGIAPGDLNEDGLMDMLVVYAGRTPLVFLRREGSTSPLSNDSFSVQEVYPRNEGWNSSAATLADLDGDGHLDIIIGNYFQDGAPVLDATDEGEQEMQASMSRASNGGSNRVLRWESAKAGENPSVSFREVAGVFDEEVSRGWTLAIGAADLDGDLLPEIYFANDFGPDRLLHNRSKPGEMRFALIEGRKSFTTPSSKVLGRDSFKGMGVDFADLNGDGFLDIYVSNIADEYALQESHFVFISTGEIELMKKGIAPYVDRSEEMGLSRSGWGWDCRFGDFDNDSVMEAIQATGFVKGEVSRWPEFHELAMANDNLIHNPRLWPRFQPGDDLSGHGHNPFFARAADGRYYDIARDIGIGESQLARGIATADVDGDGRLDFAIANQWEPSRFYHNESRTTGRFLELNLLLPVGGQESAITKIFDESDSRNLRGRAAIGARATILLPDGRRLTAEVDGGSGHSGKRSPRLHFGLGQIPDDIVLRVELNWRDSRGQARMATVETAPGLRTVLLGS